MNTQMRKGVLELCVLCMLDKRDMYGYEMVEEISANIHITEGTVYPLLKRLKDEGYVTTYHVVSQEGPARKYYKLTENGVNIKNELRSEWFSLLDGVDKIVRRDTDE